MVFSVLPFRSKVLSLKHPNEIWIGDNKIQVMTNLNMDVGKLFYILVVLLFYDNSSMILHLGNKIWLLVFECCIINQISKSFQQHYFS